MGTNIELLFGGAEISVDPLNLPLGAEISATEAIFGTKKTAKILYLEVPGTQKGEKNWSDVWKKYFVTYFRGPENLRSCRNFCASGPIFENFKL